MSQLITKRVRLSRRFFLKGLTLSRASVVVGLPPLVSMFNAGWDGLRRGQHSWRQTWRTGGESGSYCGSTGMASPSVTGFQAERVWI